MNKHVGLQSWLGNSQPENRVLDECFKFIGLGATSYDGQYLSKVSFKHQGDTSHDVIALTDVSKSAIQASAVHLLNIVASSHTIRSVSWSSCP